MNKKTSQQVWNSGRRTRRRCVREVGIAPPIDSEQQSSGEFTVRALVW